MVINVKKVKYIARVLTGVRFKKMFAVMNEIHNRTGKSKFIMFFDIPICMLRYGAGYYDYQALGFDKLNHRQRKTYLTRFKSKKLVMKCNDKNYSYIFNNKVEFNKRFADYLGRECLATEALSFDDFKKFIKGKEYIFAKPKDGDSGKGIKKLSEKDFKSSKDFYEFIINKDNKIDVIEEVIIQNKDMNKIYPLAVNSLRVATLVYNNKVNILYAIAKFGANGDYADNMDRGGLCCPVDLKTGKIIYPAHSPKFTPLYSHPYSKIKFVGFKIPHFKKVLQLATKLATVVDEVKYVGWDIYIGPKGPGVIEGNDYPGYDFGQLLIHTKTGIGILPQINKIFDNNKKGRI